MASRRLRSAVLNMGLPLSLLLAPAIVGAPAPAAATAATPESDPARVLRYTRALEASPDRADALELRRMADEMGSRDARLHGQRLRHARPRQPGRRRNCPMPAS